MAIFLIPFFNWKEFFSKDSYVPKIVQVNYIVFNFTCLKLISSEEYGLVNIIIIIITQLSLLSQLLIFEFLQRKHG